MLGDFLTVYTDNSLHCGFYCGVEEEAYLPRIILAGSHKFIHRPHKKQTYDHKFSIDTYRIVDVWKKTMWDYKTKKNLD